MGENCPFHRVALLGNLQNDSNANALVQQSRYLDVIKKLRVENPNLSVPELEKLAGTILFSEIPKSRAFYRIQVGFERWLIHSVPPKQAIRRMTGNGDISTKKLKQRIDEERTAALPLMPEKPKLVAVG